MSYFSPTPEEQEAKKLLQEKRANAIKSLKKWMESDHSDPTNPYHEEGYMLPYTYDTYMESEKWIREIPELHFHSDWGVRIIPPFAGAVVRFRVYKGEKSLSIYLDCYDRLGIYGGPYWEMYPNIDGDCSRYAMNDTTGLLSEISSILDYDVPKENAGHTEMMEELDSGIDPEYYKKLRKKTEEYFKKTNPENQGEEKGENQEGVKGDGPIQGSVEGETAPVGTVLKAPENTEAT